MESCLAEAKQVKQVFLYKIFEEVCPFFISIGMTYEQFWKQDVCITRYYKKAYEMKQKRQAEEEKWKIWEQGLYIYEAICDVSPILRTFSKVKKPLPYPDKPYGIEAFNDSIKEKNNEQEEDKKEEIKRKADTMRAQIFFENWARATSNRFNKKGENNG